MGIIDWLLAAYLAKKTHNAVNRPTVTSSRGIYDVIGMEPSGASQWKVYIRKRGDNSMSRQSFYIDSAVQQHSEGGDTFSIFWPGK
jgi:hypothetical protein